MIAILFFTAATETIFVYLIIFYRFIKYVKMKLISIIQELKKKRKYSFAMNSEFFNKLYRCQC